MTDAIAVLVGCVAGVLAGMFGVGGGFLFVPLLVGLGLEQHQATGTSLLAILPVVAAGAWQHSRHGNVRWRVAALIGAGAVVSAQAGVLVADQLSAQVLRRLFAVLLLVVAGQIALGARRRARPGPL
jgi:uncharacterized membrane protein YfcA